MNKGFYGLTKNPFDKQCLADKDVFLSNDHMQMISRLGFLREHRGFGLFTAEPGFGKTFSLRCFCNSLDRNLFQTAYICLSSVSVTEFYRQFCTALSIEPSHKKSTMFKAIQERLYHLYKEKKKPFFLVIDEAHELSACILKDLKMIMNYEFDSLNCFTLILAGEPHLNNILLKPVHEALRQRITVHYNYLGLSEAETEKYLIHKLTLAGAAASILGDDVLPAVVSYAQGCPRLLDILMNEALLLGDQLQKPALDSDIIMAAVNSLALL